MTISYDEAIEINRKIKDEYSKKGIKLVEVGQLARKQREIKNLEYITMNAQLGVEHYHHVMKVHDKDISMDIRFVEKDNFKIVRLIRTYPFYYICAIRKGLKENGYTLTDKNLIENENKQEVKIKKFKDVIDLANIKYNPISYFYQT